MGDQFDVLFYESDNVLLIVNKDGDILKSNKTAQDMLGYTLNELKQMNIKAILPHNQEDKVHDFIGKLKVSQQFESTLPLISKQYDKITTGSKLYPLTNDDNLEMTYLFSGKIDIPESYFRNLFKASGDAYLLLENDVFIDCNHKSGELLMMDQNDIIGLHPWDISPQYQADGILSKDKARDIFSNVEINKSHRFEWLHKRSTGKSFWAEVVVTSIELDSENINYLVALRDISERKLMERENRRLTERLRIATENAHIGLWDWNVQSGETEFNEEWAKICGYTLSELEPTTIETWAGLAHQGDLEDSGQLLQDHFKGITSMYECEARMKHKNGHWIWVLDRGKVVTWTDKGEPLRMIGTHTEITNIKEYSTKLEEAMKYATEMAEKAKRSDQIKSQFLANISHEIRTPMNGVVGFLEMLYHTNLSNEQIEYVSEAKSATRLMLQLINDLLDFSKIEACQLELESISFNIDKVIRETIAMITPMAEKKGLVVHVDIESSTRTAVIGDPTRLKQIIMNLLSNAIKFTNRGYIKLNSSIVPIENTDDLDINFIIKDTGIGMTSETVNSLFKPFTQADASTTRKYGGTGLGLSICKNLIEMMGGKIKVESQQGEGTTFTFDIRLKKGSIIQYDEDSNHAQPYISEVIQPQSSTGNEYLNTSNEKLFHTFKPLVLLVEDNEMNQILLKRYLNKKGVMCDISENGYEALEAIQQKEYDLVLMDCQMPRMDGYTASIEIRKLEQAGERIPIIAMTAHALVGDKEKCIASGMDEYLAKPIQFDLLDQFLLRYIQPSPNVSKYLDFIEQGRIALQEHTGIDDKDLNELYSLYMNSFPIDLEKLEEKCYELEFESVAELAHKMKGTSGNLRIYEVEEKMKELERLALQSDFDSVLQIIFELKTLFELD